MVVGTAALGWLARSRRSRALVAIGVVAPVATLLGFYVLGRYRFALLPALTVASAFGIEIVSRKRARLGRFAPLGVVLVALGIVALRPSAPEPPASAVLARAVDLHLVRRLDAAIPAYEEALQRAHGDLETEAAVLSNLALAELEAGDRESSMRRYGELDAVLRRARRDDERHRLEKWLVERGLSSPGP